MSVRQLVYVVGKTLRSWTKTALVGVFAVLLTVGPAGVKAAPSEVLPLDRSSAPMPASFLALPAGWSSISTSRLDIQYPPHLAVRAQQLSEQAEARLLSLAQQLQIWPSRHYVVRLVDSPALFAAAQPGQPPAWASGTAYPASGLMVVNVHAGMGDGLSGSWLKTFDHELVHLLLGDLFKGRPIPRWLDEGMARLLALEGSLEEWQVISQAVLLDRLIPLDELVTRFPASAGRAELAYAQSRAFLAYLIDQYGQEQLPRLLHQMAAQETKLTGPPSNWRQSSLNEALWAVTGKGLLDHEEAWEEQLNLSFVWLAALVGGASPMAIGGALLVLARRRKKQLSTNRRARWAREDALEDAYYARIAALRAAEEEAERQRQEAMAMLSGGWPVDPTPSETAPRVGDSAGTIPSYAGDEPPKAPETEGASASEEDRPPPGGWLH